VLFGERASPAAAGLNPNADPHLRENPILTRVKRHLDHPVPYIIMSWALLPPGVERGNRAFVGEFSTREGLCKDFSNSSSVRCARCADATAEEEKDEAHNDESS
jgi:hypothetical protein